MKHFTKVKQVFRQSRTVFLKDIDNLNVCRTHYISCFKSYFISTSNVFQILSKINISSFSFDVVKTHNDSSFSLNMNHFLLEKMMSFLRQYFQNRKDIFSMMLFEPLEDVCQNSILWDIKIIYVNIIHNKKFPTLLVEITGENVST